MSVRKQNRILEEFIATYRSEPLFVKQCAQRKEETRYVKEIWSGTDNVYSLKLWYFDLFDFLGDHDVPSTSSSNLDDEDVSEMDEVMRDHFKKPPPQDDRYDLMGKSIALRIRALEKRQRLIVEKKLNDIIFEAEMGLMNTPTNSYNLVYQSSSSSTTPSPSPNESFYEFNSHQARISGLGSQEEHTHPLANYLSEFRDI
ncbi:hypothetical protein FQA39_LY07349 [Lamprigera yunnana]|nr:hypothetical protein FQA39_LY07349 [Lamprigera yunnana]